VSTPRISILLPVRDARQTLGACLRSVLRQREKDWECVVVDDGSSDGSAGLAREFARRDPRVRVLGRPGLGLVPALNHGLAHCRAPLVARLDADDWMHRRRLAEQIELLDEHPSWCGVGCHVRGFPRARMGPGDRAYERWVSRCRSPVDIERELFVECPIVHPTWLFRRETLLANPYADRGWPEDYDLLLRVVLAGGRVGVLPRRRLAWRHGADRLSRRSESYSPASFTRCKAHYLARSFLGGVRQYILWGHGASGRRLLRALRAHGKTVSHIVEIHPGRIGNRIHDAPVVDPDEVGRLPRHPLLVSVAGAEARALIRAHLHGLGRVETVDFVCVA
jgi:glycosyltransferase involved in cell wall biosynthesis